jgi:hypothetical protein
MICASCDKSNQIRIITLLVLRWSCNLHRSHETLCKRARLPHPISGATPVCASTYICSHTARDTLGRSIRATIGNVWPGEPQCTQRVLMRHTLPSQDELRAQWSRVRPAPLDEPLGLVHEPAASEATLASAPLPRYSLKYMALISETVGV